MTIEQARARVEPLILAGLTHPDYQRCVDHAVLCRKLERGDISSLLKRFVSRETKEEFDGRLALTVSTVPAVWHELRGPFFQVSQLKGSQVERRFDYEDASDDERSRRIEILTQAVDHYHENRPIEDYLSEHLVQSVAMTDPNAWLLTTFDSFDYRTERAKPHPVLWPCENVPDFTKAAGVITSVTFRTEIITAEGARGNRYICYLDNDALDYWPVLSDSTGPVYTLPEGSRVDLEVYDAANRLIYQGRLLRHHAGRVPALPIGYMPDPQTQGRTYVSPLNPAICFLEKELVTGSELDIVMAKMAHPFRSEFVTPCEGDVNDGGCKGGYAPGTQAPCRVCKGEGVSQMATSSMDVRRFPMPKDLEELARLDLSKLTHFSAPDTAIVEFQLKYQERLTQRASRTLFNTETLTQTTVARTATERLAENEQKNKALIPLADCLSRIYVHAASVSAAYVDVQAGLSVVYEFPRNLLPAELSDLIAVFDAAVKAGLDAMVLQQIYLNIIGRQFADNPEELRRMLVKVRFMPYIGHSDEYVLKLSTLGKIPLEKFVLRTEQDSIFYELERDNPTFYDLAPQQQQALVDAKVAALAGQVGAAATAMASSAFRTLSMSSNTNQPVAATA